MMTKGCVYPWKDARTFDWNDEWRLKGTDLWFSPASTLWNRNDLMVDQCRLMFGEVPTELDDFIDASQVIQAEAMKTFCELFRTRKFTRFNGLVWWNVRDGWPIVSDAVVDWYGGRKLAYYALRNVQQDQLVCVIDNHEVWAVNDTLLPVSGHVRVMDSASGIVVMNRDWECPGNGSIAIGKVPWEGKGVLLLDYSVGDRRCFNWFLYGEAPFNRTDIVKRLKEINVRLK